MLTFFFAASALKCGISAMQGAHQDPQTFITAGPLMDSITTDLPPTIHGSVVPFTTPALMAIAEQLAIWAEADGAEAISKARTRSIRFIGTPHHSLLAPGP